ncbi:MAG: hypothetical protein ACYDAQ_02360 [Mycobacteriales bacterium]
MTTKVVRIEADAAQESAAAARLLGKSQSELLARAWEQYRLSAEFRSTFQAAQKAIATGDLGVIGEELQAAAKGRAAARAERTRALRAS